ncbi:hypothetical protein A4R26_17530 [Niastella populi]|uniref:Uncharacterized protein n=1 Tax=Niastella populi TaxID=550983 RepID=A0A1V9FX84_9BACT|nr:hypothetical protein A4R26_17530 [Niastella populi]
MPGEFLFSGIFGDDLTAKPFLMIMKEQHSIITYLIVSENYKRVQPACAAIIFRLKQVQWRDNQQAMGNGQ